MFFEEVWGKASGLMFLKGRISFYHVSGEVASMNAGAPSVLVSYGEYDAAFLEHCGIPGKFIKL